MPVSTKVRSTITVPNWVADQPGAAVSAAAPAQAAAGAPLTVQSGAVIPYSFGVLNLAASLTNSQLYRSIPGSTATMAQIGAPAIYRGSIVGLSCRGNGSVPAGQAAFSGWIAGAATGASIGWVSGTGIYASFVAGAYPFNAGQELDVRVTTDGAFAPAGSLDVEVILYLTNTVE